MDHVEQFLSSDCEGYFTYWEWLLSSSVHAAECQSFHLFLTHRFYPSFPEVLISVHIVTVTHITQYKVIQGQYCFLSAHVLYGRLVPSSTFKCLQSFDKTPVCLGFF